VGEQKKIVLPDGTSVILNSNTSLSYNKEFNEKARAVQLNGKAFFKVARNEQKPFTVFSGKYSTTALGTAFYVSGDSSENYTVKLLEGKVKLNSFDSKETELLNAGEEGLWKPGDKKFLKQIYDSAYLNRWLSGRINFHKTPAPEAFSILQEWYGVEIVDNRKNKLNTAINGTYENVLLEDILKVICFSLNCQTTYEQDKIIIQ
jgi:transmembrane sensor